MQTEKVYLLSLQYEPLTEDIQESMEELERLTDTAQGQVVGRRIFNRPHPDAAFFFGSGQVEAVGKELHDLGIELVIVDHELKPSQQLNLEKTWGIRVIDRTQLILDIFAKRARSHEGKLQVELAQLTYLLPHLTGKGVELSRLGGGIGTKGPGETKLEHDRRRIRNRISALKQQLETLKKTRQLHRKDRESVPLPLLSLVGYTNAGKSALLKILTKENAFVEDKLFATLDLSTRKLILPPAQEVLLTDTVGFIRRLPHHLVAAFRGTLEEVVTADLLLHVVDSSHPDWEGHCRVVEGVIQELEAKAKAVLLIFNKIDKMGKAQQRVLQYRFPEAVLISALTQEGLPQLLQTIKRKLADAWQPVTLRIPYTSGDLKALLVRRGRVLREHFGPQAITMRVELPEKFMGQLQTWQQAGKLKIVRTNIKTYSA